MAGQDFTPQELKALEKEYGPNQSTFLWDGQLEKERQAARRAFGRAMASDDPRVIREAADELAKSILKKLRPDNKYHL